MELSMGEKLKKLRQSNRYTQEYVANYIGRTKSFVCMYESDKRSPGKDTLIKLSRLFGVSLDYLIGKKDVRVNYSSLKEDTALDYKNYPIIPMYATVDEFMADEVCGHASPSDLLPDHDEDNEVFFIEVETATGVAWALVNRNSQNNKSEHYVAVKNGKTVIIPFAERCLYDDNDVLGTVRSLTYLL